MAEFIETSSSICYLCLGISLEELRLAEDLDVYQRRSHDASVRHHGWVYQNLEIDMSHMFLNLYIICV